MHLAAHSIPSRAPLNPPCLTAASFPSRPLCRSANNFERGAIDTFMIKSKDLGDLTHIVVGGWCVLCMWCGVAVWGRAVLPCTHSW